MGMEQVGILVAIPASVFVLLALTYKLLPRGGDFLVVLASGELDYQLVKQTLEWRRPARFDNVLEVEVTTRHLGNTSRKWIIWIDNRWYCICYICYISNIYCSWYSIPSFTGRIWWCSYIWSC